LLNLPLCARPPFTLPGRAPGPPTAAHTPTSQLFHAVLKGVPVERVTPAWLLRSLGRHSFGMVMLLLGLIAMVPGVSFPAGIMLAVLGFQMTMGQEAITLPHFLASRSLPTHRIARLIDRSIPAMRALEKIIRPRWSTAFMAAKRFIGLIVVVLAATLLVPIPFTNIVPAAAIMLLAFAYLEEDGVFLCVALGTSLGSLAITGVEAWATLKGADFLIGL